MTRHLNIGIELAYWDTEYKSADADMADPETGDSVRFEFAGRYGF